MSDSSDVKIIILIPVYNHPETIRLVVTDAMEFHHDVLVVDDGSDNEVAEVLSDLDVIVIRHSKNMGKGAAILSGALKADNMGYTHIITIDADGQHDPGDLPKFLSVIQANPHAIVVGKRDFQTADVPVSSVFGRRFSNFWLRVQTGQSVGDTQSGFRAYPLSILKNLKLQERHYSFEIEVLVKAIWAGIRVMEVDVKVYYPSGIKRVTHFHGVKDNLRLAMLNTKLTMLSILPVPHRKIIFDRQNEKMISVLHPVKSIKTLLTENASPEKIAVAGALGIFLGALPLIACHTIVIIMATSFLRLNKVVALTTSQFCMPPIMPALCIETGYYLRNGRFLTDISLETIGYQAIYRIFEWFIGSLVIGPVTGVIMGVILYSMAIIIKKGIDGFRP